MARSPDHVPPETLSTGELEHSIESLRRKLHSARRALLVTLTGGALLTVALLAAGFVLLWSGPGPFLERLLGARPIATTYDVFLWWSVIIATCALGGAFGDRMLRGRLRIARGWRHRVDELRHRLEHAEAELRRRRTEATSGSARPGTRL